LQKNDSRIKKSFENKKLGGYISIENLENDEENEDIELKYNMVYNSMGFLKNGNEIWMKKIEMVENYIIKNNKRPSNSDKDIEIKELGYWINTQQQNYKNNEKIMKDENIRKCWIEFTTKYKQYFLTNEEWINSLKQVEDYIIKNEKKPSDSNKDIEIKKLSKWIDHQQQNYKNNEKSMKDENIRKCWKEFTINYKQYFLTNDEIWVNSLKQVEDYIIFNNKRPPESNKDIEIKQLGSWINTQQQNYKNNERIMKNENIRKYWKEFTTKYKQYFLTNEEEWVNSLKIVENYIIKNNKRPSSSDKDIEIKRFGVWIIHQQKNFLKNEQIMKNETIKKEWIDFTTKYKQYFLTNEEEWINSLKLVENYIIKNNKRPSRCDKNIEIKQLGKWISHQQQNYKNNENIMKDENIRKYWEEFTTKYKQYFV
jgi:hypothetical protein